MKTILVPVDFTATSENAVTFAIEWSKQYGYDHIILFKTFYESMFELMAAAYAFTAKENLDTQRKEARRQLKRLRKQVAEKAGSGITVSTAMSELPLLRGILKILNSDASPELVVLGSDHHTVPNGSFISGNVISIARACPVKLLIVPAGITYRPVKHILVPCDTGSIENLDNLDRYKPVLKTAGARLNILNVQAHASTEAVKTREESVHAYLGDIPHRIYYALDKDVISGVLSFASLHPAELIIALPGRHSFLYYLVNKSISEGIYRNAGQAVLILK